MTIDVNALGFTIVAIVLIAGAFWGISLWLRIRIHTRLLDDIKREDFEDFKKRINSRLTCQALSPYARELLRFQAFTAEKKQDEMVKQFNRLMGMRLADPVRASLLMEGFSAFIKVNDKKHAGRILDAMTPQLVDEKRKEFCNRQYARAFGA
jgi:hypothetical protein